MLRFSALPMPEAIAFWKDKVQLSPSEFAKLTDEAKLKAFAISGMAKGKELETVFSALQKSLEKGISFDQFKAESGDIFERRGWNGKRAWRIDNIFRTNIQTAYNVGHYQQMMRVAAQRPYWQYHAVNDRRTRPLHRALHGKIFPVGHAFWNTWFPPNGFRCRCTVTSLSKYELAAEGLKVETKDPTGGIIEPIDPVTGVRLPARPLMPDTGWDFNPGKTAWGDLAAPKQGKFVDLPDLKGAADFRRRELANVRPGEINDLVKALLPGGQSDNFYLEAFRKLYGEEQLITDALGEPVILSTRSFMAVKDAVSPIYKFDKFGHGEIIPLLQGMIEQPLEVWLTPQINEAGRVRITKRYIGLWKTEDKKRIGGLAVFEVSDGAFQGVTAFEPIKKGSPNLDYLERQRKGLLLYPKQG